jgi:hypothetical protein
MAYCAVRSRPDFGPCRMHIASGRRGDHVGCSREDGHTVGCRSAVVDGVGVCRRDRLDSFAKQDHTAEFAQRSASPGRDPDMTRRRDDRWRIALCGAALTLVVAGCTSEAADGATPSGPPARTATPSVAAPPSTVSGSATVTAPMSSRASTLSSTPSSPKPTGTTKPTPTSLDSAAREKADRAAIEAQWIKFWDAYENIIRTPSELRSSALDAVSVDPIKSRILGAARKFESQGLDYYGSVVQHPYWIESIGGGNFAVIRDCQDQSNYGSVYVSSRKKRTVGVPRDSLQAGFVKARDGVWRVQNIQFLENLPC